MRKLLVSLVVFVSANAQAIPTGILRPPRDASVLDKPLGAVGFTSYEVAKINEAYSKKTGLPRAARLTVEEFIRSHAILSLREFALRNLREKLAVHGLAPKMSEDLLALYRQDPNLVLFKQLEHVEGISAQRARQLAKGLNSHHPPYYLVFELSEAIGKNIRILPHLSFASKLELALTIDQLTGRSDTFSLGRYGLPAGIASSLALKQILTIQDLTQMEEKTLIDLQIWNSFDDLKAVMELRWQASLKSDGCEDFLE